MSTVLCCEGRALLVVGYLFLLNLLWTVDLFFLLTKGNLSLRLVPVVLAHLLFHARYVPGCSPSLQCRFLSLSGSNCELYCHVFKTHQKHSNIILLFTWSSQIESSLFKLVIVVFVQQVSSFCFACCRQRRELYFVLHCFASVRHQLWMTTLLRKIHQSTIHGKDWKACPQDGYNHLQPFAARSMAIFLAMIVHVTDGFLTMIPTVNQCATYQILAFQRCGPFTRHLQPQCCS